MKNEIEELIRNLMSTDNDMIKKATADLQEAYKNPQTVPTLCDVVVTCPEIQIRQYAAVLLSKRLGKLRNWQMVPPEQQQIIKQGILNALVQEKEKPVRNAIAMFIGALVRHESEKADSWLSDLLKYIYAQCSSTNPKDSELGSSIFATLADTAPDQFVPHMESICEMFSAAVMATESDGNMVIPVVVNLMVGITELTPFVVGNQIAEQAILKTIPLLLKAMQVLTYSQDTDNFVRGFDIFDNFAEYAPKLLNNHFKEIMVFCLEITSNKQLDVEIRVQGVVYIGRLVRLKKKAVVKQKMVESILLVVFNMMSDENEANEDSDEYFVGDDSLSPVSSASQTLDQLALNIAPEKLIPPLLQLLEPALQGHDIYNRRAAFLCMAIIAEGCAEAICNKYLETMLGIIKAGIIDQSPIVRNAAFFALGQFSEYLQPDISSFAPQILPVLFDFLHQLNVELKASWPDNANANANANAEMRQLHRTETIQYMNQLQLKRKSVLTNYMQGSPEPKHIGRMFYALETFCENLEEQLVPHLPILMERLFEAMNSNNSVRLRDLALCAIAAAVTSAKEHMMPYFQDLISLLQTYLVKTDDNDIISLRAQAIDTLASLAHAIGKENFLPLANDTMAFCLGILDEKEDNPNDRRAVYNLIAALAAIVNEDMATVFPRIMDRIMDSVISMEEITPLFKEGDVNCPNIENVANEIDIEDTDDEDDDDDEAFTSYNVENEYLVEKEEAILCLKEFSIHSRAAFSPFLQPSFENVYKMIDHPNETIRKAAIECLCSFVIALHKLNVVDGVRKANEILMPKLMHIVRQDEDITVAIHALDNMGDVMKEVREHALPAKEMYDGIFTLINDVVLNKLACQFDEPSSIAGGGDDDEVEDSESDEMLIEAAGNLLSKFGFTMPSENFAVYFERFYPFFSQKFKKAKKSDMRDQRAFIYGALSECIEPLGKQAATYFDLLCPFFIGGLTDPEPKSRQNSCYGLGELVLYAEEKSFEGYATILQALSEALAKETTASSRDNICGAVARLILTNHTLVPLQQVLPVFLRNLPLREDFSEYKPIFKSFEVLFVKARQIFGEYAEQIVAIAIHVLFKKEYTDPETCNSAICIIEQVRENYPEKYQSVANSNQEIYNFLQTL